MSWFSSWFGYSDPEVRYIPYKSNQSIVLDMDECLIHTWDITRTKYLKSLGSPQTVSIRRHLFEVFPEETNKFMPMYGILRPGLIDFLNYCFSRFDNVILWSAGTDFYVEQVTDYIFSKTEKVPKKVMARSNCNYQADNGSYAKPLAKLASEVDKSLTLENCFFVDDNPDSGVFNKENHILIPPFDPDATVASISKALDTDRALYDLIEWFESQEAINCKDVRKIDKSNIFKK